MDYKSLIGYGDKKKKSSKPKKNKVLEGIKKELNLNEGPSYEYSKHIKKIDKLYDMYGAAVGDFQTLLKKKGLKKEAKDVSMIYGKLVYKFQKTFEQIVRKLL